MERKRLEIIVGGFVVLGIAIFTFFVFFINGVYLFKPGYYLNVRYSFISGIGQGAPVRFAGVPVGEVSALRTEYDQQGKPYVVIKIWLKESVVVREKTKVEIRGAFALSEAHIEITTNGQEDGAILSNGDYINGVDPIPLDNLIRQAEDISASLDEMLKNANAFIADEEVRTSLKDVITNSAKLTAKLNDILYSSEEDIYKAIDSAEKSFTQLHETVQGANDLIETIETKKGTVGKLLYDDEMYNEMMAFIKDLKAHPWKLLQKPKKKHRFLFF